MIENQGKSWCINGNIHKFAVKRTIITKGWLKGATSVKASDICSVKNSLALTLTSAATRISQ
jgi:hypothetical protein